MSGIRIPMTELGFEAPELVEEDKAVEQEFTGWPVDPIGYTGNEGDDFDSNQVDMETAFITKDGKCLYAHTEVPIIPNKGDLIEFEAMNGVYQVMRTKYYVPREKGFKWRCSVVVERLYESSGTPWES